MTEATEPTFLRDTRRSYDVFAADYARLFDSELKSRPLDRGLLAGFVEVVKGGADGPIADIGCGPGRVTAHLQGLGADVFGIDLSPAMVAQARQAYPGLRFDVGSMLNLEVGDGCLAGVVAWYSIIHIPDEELLRLFREFTRVLTVGGHVLLAFQVGDEIVHRAEAGGQAVSLDFHLRQPDRVSEYLVRAGFDIRAHLIREADDGQPFPETTPQAFLVARKSLTR